MVENVPALPDFPRSRLKKCSQAADVPIDGERDNEHWGHILTYDFLISFKTNFFGIVFSAGLAAQGFGLDARIAVAICARRTTLWSSCPPVTLAKEGGRVVIPEAIVQTVIRLRRGCGGTSRNRHTASGDGHAAIRLRQLLR